jgi:hypothetical protein
MEQEETGDDGEESDDGDYVLRTARVRSRVWEDSDEEERPKRRRKKNRGKERGTEKAKEKGARRARRAMVPQYQINAMIQWGLNHPMVKGENQKVYWSKFVEEVSILLIWLIIFSLPTYE